MRRSIDRSVRLDPVVACCAPRQLRVFQGSLQKFKNRAKIREDYTRLLQHSLRARVRHVLPPVGQTDQPPRTRSTPCWLDGIKFHHPNHGRHCPESGLTDQPSGVRIVHAALLFVDAPFATCCDHIPVLLGKDGKERKDVILQKLIFVSLFPITLQVCLPSGAVQAHRTSRHRFCSTLRLLCIQSPQL